MAEMSKWECIDRLIFVNPRISIRSKLIRNAKAIINDSNDSIGVNDKIFPLKFSSKLYIYSPISFLPFKNVFPVFSRIEDRITLKIIRHLNNGKPYILFMNCPNIFSHYILDELLGKAELSIFDFSDDFSELGYGKDIQALFRCNANKYAKKADLVLTVNEHIKNKYSFLNSNIHVIRNATNYDNFQRTSFEKVEVLEALKDAGVPIIGYSGIANLGRIDSQLLDFLMEKRTNWKFVFVGPAHSNFIERYGNCPSVCLLGPVEYEKLPSYIRYFDVAFVPFETNENTKGNDLLKLHDFLAMGKPIVSTEIGGAKDLKDVIRVGGTPFEFLEAIEEALQSDNEEDMVRRKNVALTNSWHNRVKQLEQISRKELRINNTIENEM